MDIHPFQMVFLGNLKWVPTHMGIVFWIIFFFKLKRRYRSGYTRDLGVGGMFFSILYVFVTFFTFCRV